MKIDTLAKNTVRTVRHVGLVAAFSVLETLVMITAIGTLCGVGAVAVTQAKEAADRSKLDSDVRMLNAAVQSYLGNGGVVPAASHAEEVLAVLKDRAADDEYRSLVGVCGSLIDPRLRGISAGVEGRVRAVWNPGTNRFVVATAGEGFSAFVLGEAAPSRQDEGRRTHHKYSQTSGWVWDSGVAVETSDVDPPVDTSTSGDTPVVYTPPGGGEVRRLLSPEIEPFDFSVDDEGFYGFAVATHAATLQERRVQLIDPNEPGSSKLFYRLNSGDWQVYTEPFQLPVALDTTIEAYAASLNAERWQDSANDERELRTIYFKGATGGYLFGPTGDNGLVTNLAIGIGDLLDGVLAGWWQTLFGIYGPSGLINGQHFNWGQPAAGYATIRNSLDLAPRPTSFYVTPGQWFELGRITYTNSTTYVDTNATKIKVRVGLDLTVPVAQEKLYFDLDLLSTLNYGEDADQDADYVRIREISTAFNGTVQGKVFKLELRFGESDSDQSFTTIDTFHVHEGATATGTLYGSLVEVGAGEDGMEGMGGLGELLAGLLGGQAGMQGIQMALQGEGQGGGAGGTPIVPNFPGLPGFGAPGLAPGSLFQ